MPRPLRDDFPGAWHHVTHRAARRKTIFRTDADYMLFLDTLRDTVLRFHIEAHAYALMPNHYHLLLHSVEGNLSRAMRHLNGVFTQRLNAANEWDGPIFRGRFTSRLIHGEQYLLYVLAYIHLNPLKANLVTRLDSAETWTSHRSYVGKDTPPPWLSTGALLDVFGGPAALHETTLALHRGKEEWPVSGFSAETGFTTAGTFTRAERRRMGKGKRPAQEDRRALISAICKITGVTTTRLRQKIRGARGNPERRFAVWALSKSTTLTQGEIGALLEMSSANVAKDLARSRSLIAEFDAWVDAWRENMSIGMD
jgi:REP element-mobilizing transposase RayT